jgi:two-component system, chemotaxis family, protein-glutamate methylesterase/glutaminase
VTLTRRDVVAIGASAGGVPALRALAAALPADLPSSLVVVLHVGRHPSRLPSLLESAGPLSASHVVDGEPLRHGHIHVAPPDHHVLIEGRTLRLQKGPREHHTRPAIDPLFRSAALSLGARSVGVVLTGRLDDGTAGLQAIKACGGVAIVQDPNDALEPSMPSSAMRYVEVDHCVPLAGMAALIESIATQPVTAKKTPPAWLAHEHDITILKGEPMEHLKAIAKPSTFVCPDCSGSLWQVDGARPARFRCHTGHGFSLRSLHQAHVDKTEDALWSAIRALEEQHMLLDGMAAEHGDDAARAQRLEAAARAADEQADRLRELVQALPAAA